MGELPSGALEEKASEAPRRELPLCSSPWRSYSGCIGDRGRCGSIGCRCGSYQQFGLTLNLAGSPVCSLEKTSVLKRTWVARYSQIFQLQSCDNLLQLVMSIFTLYMKVSTQFPCLELQTLPICYLTFLLAAMTFVNTFQYQTLIKLSK